MSNQKIFYGDVYPFTFFSREGDTVNVEDRDKYIPESFISHEFVTSTIPDYTIGYYIRVYNEEVFIVAFYLRPKDLPRSENIIENLKGSTAYIEIAVDLEEKDLTINEVHVIEDEQGKGYATYLMILGMFYTQIIDPLINVVKLDDTSDNSVNDIEDERPAVRCRRAGSNNLYCKLGFEYEDSRGPEMIGDISKIVMGNMDTSKKRMRSEEESEESPTKRRKRGGKSKKVKRKKKTKKRKKSRRKRIKSKHKRDKN
jgi:GNAT superfamily N-acetyltransferase